MKRFLTVLTALVVAVGALVQCKPYDDAWIKEELADLKAQVANLQSSVNALDAYKTLLDKSRLISEVKDHGNGTFTIYFADGTAPVTLIADIACNAGFAADAIQRADEDALCEALRRSWRLNCDLDSGTCPPSVAPIADVFVRHGTVHKLLGAGGGGYLLAVAPDPAAAAAIREDLLRTAPNPGARFVYTLPL